MEAVSVASPTSLIEADGKLGGWFLDQNIWRIELNASHEQIILTSNSLWGSVIDQIVVDTYCIPEPASMSLLILGCFAVFKKRRQRCQAAKIISRSF
ncbi:MAG: PEP-CTERM sorting domain-containing protein [Planctomycetota bacterium]|nr:PEP-CTERM sorting domain-containing protein [Planctomycetota bacterium]